MAPEQLSEEQLGIRKKRILYFIQYLLEKFLMIYVLFIHTALFGRVYTEFLSFTKILIKVYR